MEDNSIKLRDDDAGLDLIRDLITCETAADMLKMRGRGPARFCPRCGANSDLATLMLGTRYFECGSCYFRGDVIDLVVGVKKCTPDEAIAMLTELSLEIRKKERNKDQGPATAENLQARVLAASDDVERGILARMAFLESCRPLKDQVVELLLQQGISREVMEHCNLRYAPDDAISVFKKLDSTFGRTTLAKAGLLQPQGTAFTDGGDSDIILQTPAAGLQRVFEPYDAGRVRYLVIPYYDLNQLLYLKAIPLAPGKILTQRKLPRSLATAPIAPCPFNAEAISQSGRLIILRQELDAMAAMTAGYSAIGVSSLSRFQPGLVPLLNGRDVFICGDEDLARSKTVQSIDTIFVTGGAVPPKFILRRSGESIADALTREFMTPDADSLLVESQINSSGLNALAGNEDVYAAAEAASRSVQQRRYEIPVSDRLKIVVTPIAEEGKQVVFVRFQRKTLLGSWEDQEWGRIRIDPKLVPEVASAMARLAETLNRD